MGIHLVLAPDIDLLGKFCLFPVRLVLALLLFMAFLLCLELALDDRPCRRLIPYEENKSNIEKNCTIYLEMVSLGSIGM